MPLGSALMRLAGIGEGKDAVDGDADGAVIEQAPHLLQLRTVRAYLRCRNRKAKLPGLLSAGKAQGENGKQRAARLERAQETARRRAAYRVEHEIHVSHDIFRRGPGIVDELVGA